MPRIGVTTNEEANTETNGRMHMHPCRQERTKEWTKERTEKRTEERKANQHTDKDGYTNTQKSLSEENMNYLGSGLSDDVGRLPNDRSLFADLQETRLDRHATMGHRMLPHYMVVECCGYKPHPLVQQTDEVCSSDFVRECTVLHLYSY